MNESSKFEQLRKPLLTLATLGVVVFPMLASAGAARDAESRDPLFAAKSSHAIDAPVVLYTRIKTESRKLCGDPSLFLTGSVKRSAQIRDCYEGTLSAAVARLDNPRVSALHQEASGRL